MAKSHQNRVAVITGAAGGLGHVFSMRLAEEGCHLAITDQYDCTDLYQKASDLGGNVYFEKCDLSKAGDIKTFSENVLNKFGRVDILINNAAVMMQKTLYEMDLETFRLYEKVNLEAPLMLCKAFIPGMSDQGYGRIVNMTSSSAWHPHEGFLGYVTTKMGIIGMTRYLAVELGNKGITVNALTPSLTRHPGNENTLPEEFFEKVRQKQAIQRTATPDDVVGTLLFLTSDDAAFMTGQTLVTDGGAVFL